MGYLTRQPPSWRRVVAAAESQYGVLSHAQLLALGLSRQAIKHRVARGKVHRVYRGVYAVGRPQLDRNGQRVAALLACGSGSALSHSASAEFWRFGPQEPSLELTISPPRTIKHPGLQIHRSTTLTAPELITVAASGLQIRCEHSSTSRRGGNTSASTTPSNG